MFRHKPTGLYFKNRRSSYRSVGSNLSAKGKVYLEVPTFKWISGSYFIGPKGEKIGNFKQEDWEIVITQVSR
jgi:hypothetical protein